MKDDHINFFINEYFLLNISSNQVKLGKSVSKWRVFYNLYCTVFSVTNSLKHCAYKGQTVVGKQNIANI
jgi:hypothetical protein